MAMENAERRILHALQNTKVFRQPRQKLATFGVTTLSYHMVTEPSYTDLVRHEPEAVVREGIVVAERPAIVTPSYMLKLEGFGPEARQSMEYLTRNYGGNSPGILYAYKNEAKRLDIVGGNPEAVADRITKELDRDERNLAAVIIGVDELWDVSLLKFIYEFTASSLVSNLQEMHGRGLLEPDPGAGVPRGATQRIEELFQAVERGEADPSALKTELDRWDLFRRYEDRFLALFRRKRF